MEIMKRIMRDVMELLVTLKNEILMIPLDIFDFICVDLFVRPPEKEGVIVFLAIAIGIPVLNLETDWRMYVSSFMVTAIFFMVLCAPPLP